MFVIKSKDVPHSVPTPAVIVTISFYSPGTCKHTLARAHAHERARAHTHIYTHKHTHTHTHTHTQKKPHTSTMRSH